MKISHVLTSVNENSKYIKFIPLFIKTWTYLFPEIEPIILYTGQNIDEIIVKYNISPKYLKYIHHFYIESVDTCFTAQIIRIFYPALVESDNFVIISDIDMIPLNRKYYENVDATTDQFICYRSDCLGNVMYPICYNAATPKKWGEVFQIFSQQDLRNQINHIYNRIDYKGRENQYWYTDQFHLYYILSQRKDVIFLKDNQTGYYRLPFQDYNLPNFSERVKNGIYNDYHMSKDCDLEIDQKIVNTLIQSDNIF